jgi:hypothetical protein
VVQNSFTWLVSHNLAQFIIHYALCLEKSPDSVASIATGYRLDDRGVGVRVPVGSKIFSSHVVQPPIQWIPGALSPGVNTCGGGVEYLHRDPASRKRRRNGAKKGRAIA